MNCRTHPFPMNALRTWVYAAAALLSGVAGIHAGDARLLTFTNFATFHREATGPGVVTLVSPELSPGFQWRELVVSWNAATNVALFIEARPVTPPGARYLSMGRWTAHPDSGSPRESARGEREPWGEVQTDVLVLRDPTVAAQVRVELRGPEQGLRRLCLAFSADSAQGGAVEPHREAWGRELAVPIRSQAEYPEGVSKWCSPTSTTMLMAYWGEQRGRVEWIPEVPVTAAGVLDPGWGGTGNWPFNMAFAGSPAGLNGAVSRFRAVGDLERWVAAGLPAAASVSYALLKGKPAVESGDGHLIVVRGFTADGDVVVNDPGVRRERVRRVFPRANFERAWAHSGRTVYLVWPEGQGLPEGPVFPR